MKKTVCVIGCGPGGIASLKQCIDGGLLPTCYESSDHVGGLWNSLNKNAVPDCTVTNTSKELSCFSDFPMPDNFPNFMYADKLLEYFESYITIHGLMQYIKLGCRVVNLDVCDTHSNCLCAECAKSAGKYWKVTVQKGNEQFDAYYDFLIVAAGFNGKPFVAKEVIEVLKGFTGKVIHSSKYRSWEEFENQRVVVCGLGNSGGDIASEVSRHAEQVYLATKHGSYVMNRMRFSGYPLDLKVIRRSSNLMPQFLKKMLVPMICNGIFDHQKFGLEPFDDGVPLPPNPIINDEIWTRISTGRLLMKQNMVKTCDKTVFFSDGSKIEDVDAIILCTGYQRSFPFLSNQELLGIPAEGKFLSLYKFMFPVKHAGRVAIIGETGVAGSVFPVWEMQSRYAVEVFRGAVNLPPTKEMEESLQKHSALYKKVGILLKEPLWVNYISYQDEIAEAIGVKPSLWQLLFSDPVLAFRLFFGPSCPYQYRLTGPGSWNGARDAVLTLDRRIWHPLTPSLKLNRSDGSISQFFPFLFLIIIIAVFFKFIL